MKRLITILGLVGLLFRMSGAGLAGTLSVTVSGGGGMAVVGWSAAQTTVAQAFAGQSIPEGTIVFAWNEALQSWDTIGYEFGEWSSPQYVLATARGFYLANYSATTKTYVLNYTEIPSSTWSVELVGSPTGRLYFLAFAWPRHGWLEQPPSPYSSYPHMNWPGVTGDFIDEWYGYWQQSQVRFDNSLYGPRHWNSGDHHSPYIGNWEGFFYRCYSTRTWTQQRDNAEP